MVLPPLPALQQHLEPMLALSWTDESGWHYHATKPFPGAEVIMYDDLGHVALLGSRRVAAAIIERLSREDPRR